MKTAAINIAKAVLNGIYGIQKLMSVKNRIVFISRQSNSPSYDITKLAELCERDGIGTVILCRALENNASSIAGYAFHMLKQMHYMATSRVVVLDSYCIAASILKHRESLKIVQMWHALGSMKKFSYSILDQGEGRSSSVAKAMKMHNNYDFIFTSSEASRPAFAEAFGYAPEYLTVMSLPRVDALMDKNRDTEVRDKILGEYPQLSSDKKTILYAPTLRKNFDITEAADTFIDAIDLNKYNLIIKLHPLTKGEINRSGAIVDREFSTMDMFCACDYVVTDYSAITYEAALKGKPLFFYAFDIDEYADSRSFYFDYNSEMPGVISREAKEIAGAIDSEQWDEKAIKDFADKYVEKQGNCSEEILDFLKNLLE